METIMKTSALRLYALDFSQSKTYLAAGLFVVGNLLLPQLLHQLPQGGATWLPIYLFTLIGAYKYGWKVGLLTALLSPVANTLLFGMPSAAMLPVLLVKSTILALLAGYVAQRTQRATLLQLGVVILGYQLLGSLFEWALVGNLHQALQDLRLGLPGMLLQLVGGWVVINLLIRK